jgi:hypothetical protein
MHKNLYTKDEFAEILHIKPSTFNKLVSLRKLPGPDVKVSQQIRFWSSSHIERFLQSKMVVPSEVVGG